MNAWRSNPERRAASAWTGLEPAGQGSAFGVGADLAVQRQGPARPGPAGLSWLALSLAFCLADATTVVAAGIASRWSLPEIDGHDVAEPLLLGLAAALVVIVLYRAGHYSRLTILQELRPARIGVGWLQALGLWLLVATVAAGFSPAAFRWLWPDHPAAGSAPPGRIWLPLFALLGLGGMIATRAAWNRVRPSSRGDALVRARTVMVGSGDAARPLLASLLSRPASGIELIGVVGVDDDAEPGPVAGAIDELPRLGRVEDLGGIIQRHAVGLLIIALPWSAAAHLAALIRHASQFPVDICVVPDPQMRHFFPRRAVMLAGNPVLSVRTSPITGVNALLKRAEDIVIASLGLIVLSPVLVLLAVAIKLDSSGPLLFRQPRFGFNNQVIHVSKFRSMYTHLADPGSERQTCKGDARITRMGRFLRRHSLDELPQLLDVLRGDMSIVGPRPHALSTRTEGKLLHDALDGYVGRAQVKPGITGWAQVNGWRGELDTHLKLSRRVAMDIEYIENWSLLFDLRILLRTVFCVLRDTNAY